MGDPVSALLGVFTKIGTAVAGTALPTATTATATGASVASTVIATGAAISGAIYQSNILKAKAEAERQNAERVRAAGRVNAQEADFEALAAMAQDSVLQAASGFSLASPSFIRRRDRNAINARLNRNRIVEDAEIEAIGALNRARFAGMEARATRTGAVFDLAAGFTRLGKNLIDEASTVNNQKAQSVGVYS